MSVTAWAFALVVGMFAAGIACAVVAELLSIVIDTLCDCGGE